MNRNHLAPIIVQMGQQNLHAGHGRMNVAIYCALVFRGRVRPTVQRSPDANPRRMEARSRENPAEKN